MTVASFLGPDQPHIKDSSDIHISFYIVLSDLFSRKTLVVWEPPQRLSYQDLYS